MSWIFESVGLNGVCRWLQSKRHKAAGRGAALKSESRNERKRRMRVFGWGGGEKMQCGVGGTSKE